MYICNESTIAKNRDYEKASTVQVIYSREAFLDVDRRVGCRQAMCSLLYDDSSLDICMRTNVQSK